jgi:CheY-like chemotaxis protein/anti-sigma regulatory factor (Ser/Thr protein kinase)
MTTILVVDDSAVERRRVGALLERPPAGTSAAAGEAMRVRFAENGRQALEVMRQEVPDLVITDLQMPELDGVGLVREVHATYPSVPVILMTAHGSEDVAAQALRIGAAGYVPKRRLAQGLREAVADLLHLARAARQQQDVLEYLAEREDRFVLPNELALVAPLVGHLQRGLKQRKFCDEAGEMRVAVALREALVNAFVHGNLEVSSALKEADYQAYWQLIERRQSEPPYRDRRVHLHVRETTAELAYTIRDEGPGFDPRALPDPTDPSNLEKVSGRGLLLIRTFMEEVRFNAAGNEITMIKRRAG